MKRTIAIAVTVALGLAACGGGDDDAADTEPAEQVATDDSQPSSSDDSDDSAGDDTSTGEPDDTGDDNAADDDAADEQPADDAVEEQPADDAVESDSAGGGSIGSIDDIPPRCRELMAEFLQDLEPVVGQIDWQTATAQDFEQIAPEFEQFATEFDADSASEECNDLDMDDDVGFELIIEFADDVAPDTVPFFEFLEGMRSAFVPGGDDSASGDVEDSDTIETCDQMIAGLRELMSEYDSFDQMPLSELTKYSGIGTVMMTCTPEQLELLDSDEFAGFLNG